MQFPTVKEEQVAVWFNAQIREEIVLDDGAEPQRAFVIEGRLDSKATLPETRVVVARFPAMNWVGESWGRRAIVQEQPDRREPAEKTPRIAGADLRRPHRVRAGRGRSLMPAAGPSRALLLCLQNQGGADLLPTTTDTFGAEAANVNGE